MGVDRIFKLVVARVQLLAPQLDVPRTAVVERPLHVRSSRADDLTGVPDATRRRSHRHHFSQRPRSVRIILVVRLLRKSLDILRERPVSTRRLSRTIFQLHLPLSLGLQRSLQMFDLRLVLRRLQLHVVHHVEVLCDLFFQPLPVIGLIFNSKLLSLHYLKFLLHQSLRLPALRNFPTITRAP